jgi:hypothetical protein
MEPTVNPQFSDDETGENFYRCPLALLTPEAAAMVELSQYAAMGIMPFGGGILEQPAWILARIRYVLNCRSEYLAEKETHAHRK